MKKYLILCFILAFTLTSVNAQDKDSDKAEKADSCCDAATVFAPQKGDFTAAMIFGQGAYLNGGLVVPSSNGPVSGDAPSDNTVNGNSNSITNMVGAEGRYYIKDNFAISFSGGAILRNTPETLAISGVPNTSVPAYNAVVANERINVTASIGGQWLFKTKNERLFPYVGFALPFDYARQSNFQQLDTNLDIVDLGARHTEMMAFGLQAVAGVDYYVAKDVFFGFDIKPVSYSYAFSTKSPGPGLFALEADTTTVSFFAQFSFKVGFKF